MKKAAVKWALLYTLFLIASVTCFPVQGVASHGVTALSGTPGTPQPKPGTPPPDGGGAPFPPCGAFVCPSTGS